MNVALETTNYINWSNALSLIGLFKKVGHVDSFTSLHSIVNSTAFKSTKLLEEWFKP